MPAVRSELAYVLVNWFDHIIRNKFELCVKDDTYYATQEHHSAKCVLANENVFRVLQKE